MTARTRVVRFRGRADKRIIMAVRTARRTYRDARMAGVSRMQRFPATGMTRRTVAASCRNSRLQIRNSCMAERTITIMHYGNCRICGCARIMAVRTGSHAECHIP